MNTVNHVIADSAKIMACTLWKFRFNDSTSIHGMGDTFLHANLERKLAERHGSPGGKGCINGETAEGGRNLHRTIELIRGIHRIQMWIQSLNGGWSQTLPIQILGQLRSQFWRKGDTVAAQYEQVQAEIQRQAEFQRVQYHSDSIQSSPIYLDSINSKSIHSESIGSIQVQWNSIQVPPMDSNPFGSIPVTPIKLDQCR